MKITKKQLRRIIKEEKSKVMKEYRASGSDAIDTIHRGLEKLLDEAVATLPVDEIENIARTLTGSDFDEATRSLAKIALGQIGSQYSDYRGG